MKAESLPENLKNLHSGEEQLRIKSIEAIEASSDILIHAHTIERTMNMVEHFSRQYKNTDEEQLTIQLLGIRLFNGAAAALKLLLSGYYQASAFQLRDLLETAFLLNYFTTDKKLISEWCTCSKKIRKEKFGPFAIRKALDDRDGFTERKREAAYNLLCEIAAHPTPKGFAMLTPIPGGLAHIGPFFEFTAMRATISELAKILVEAGTVFTQFFEFKCKLDLEIKIDFMESNNSWLKRFFNASLDPNSIEKLRQLASTLEK